MIGVDVVDLSCSFNRTKHSLEAYKNRILNKTEYLFCDTMLDIHCIWAMKESAYKCHFKKTGKEFINPKRILVSNLNKHSGLFDVVIDDENYSGRFEMNTEYVFAICTNTHHPVTINEVFIKHTCMPVSAETELAHFFKSASNKARFQWHQTGFPMAIVIGKDQFAYSRSHHGAYYISVIGAN